MPETGDQVTLQEEGVEVTGTDMVHLRSQDTRPNRIDQNQLITNHSTVPHNMYTPIHHAQIVPKRLFTLEEDGIDNTCVDVEKMNVELLLINTLMITAVKVQTVIENFIKNKNYTSIFCFTETKVESLSLKPIGIKIFSKHRNKKEKKGGGLIIGYKNDKKNKIRREQSRQQ